MTVPLLATCIYNDWDGEVSGAWLSELPAGGEDYTRGGCEGGVVGWNVTYVIYDGCSESYHAVVWLTRLKQF
jgi:hypothetical protein